MSVTMSFLHSSEDEEEVLEDESAVVWASGKLRTPGNDSSRPVIFGSVGRPANKQSNTHSNFVKVPFRC